jgi:hypothetical protein
MRLAPFLLLFLVALAALASAATCHADLQDDESAVTTPLPPGLPENWPDFVPTYYPTPGPIILYSAIEPDNIDDSGGLHLFVIAEPS